MTTVHAYTASQHVQDGPDRKGNKRNARACAQNIIPHSTGAAKALGKVVPELDGKLDGHALRVPTITGSVTELVVTLNKEVTVDEVNEAVKKTTEGKRIIRLQRRRNCIIRHHWYIIRFSIRSNTNTSCR